MPQSQRLRSCALVCKAWALAAAAATRSVTLIGSAATDVALKGLEAWLEQHSSNLSSLEVEVELPHGPHNDWASLSACSCSVTTQFQLPCAALVQLTSLSLGGLVLSPGPQQQQGSSADSIPAAVPQLAEALHVQAQWPRSLQVAGRPNKPHCSGPSAWWTRPLPRVAELQHSAAPGADSPSPALAATLHSCSRLQRLNLHF